MNTLSIQMKGLVKPDQVEVNGDLFHPTPLREFFADPPAIEGSEWLRLVAEGKMPPDPLGDLAVDIVEELEREIVSRETAWHDISLHETVSEIIRRHLTEAIQKHDQSTRAGMHQEIHPQTPA